jgi:hypothetical protein
MKTITLILVTLLLAACLNPEQLQMARDRFEAERQEITRALTAGEITQQEAQDRLWIVESAERGAEAAAGAVDWDPIVWSAAAVVASLFGVRLTRGAPAPRTPAQAHLLQEILATEEKKKVAPTA